MKTELSSAIKESLGAHVGENLSYPRYQFLNALSFIDAKTDPNLPKKLTDADKKYSKALIRELRENILLAHEVIRLERKYEIQAPKDAQFILDFLAEAEAVYQRLQRGLQKKNRFSRIKFDIQNAEGIYAMRDYEEAKLLPVTVEQLVALEPNNLKYLLDICRTILSDCHTDEFMLKSAAFIRKCSWIPEVLSDDCHFETLKRRLNSGSDVFEDFVLNQSLIKCNLSWWSRLKSITESFAKDKESETNDNKD